jgi:hypothetical protein
MGRVGEAVIENLEQAILKLSVAPHFRHELAPLITDSEVEIVDSFIRGFDGHKKFLAVLRKLDEEIAIQIRQCRFS